MHTIEHGRREHRRTLGVQAVRQDIVVALRLLRKSPAFTIAAVLTLALGIGANAAVFSIVNKVLLQPLPYANADRLVQVWERHEPGYGNLPWPTFVDLDTQSASFDAMAAYGAGELTVIGNNQAARVRAASVSRDFFATFGVTPALGRLTAADEHTLGGPPVVVVSHAFWKEKLGAPQSLDDVRIKLDVDYSVIGVLEPGFGYPNDTELWAPLERTPQSTSRTAHNWNVVALLRAKVTPEAAERELSSLINALKSVHSPDFDASGAVIQPLQESMTGALAKPLYLLLAASGVLLLAACTNLASGQLARGTARAGEMAVRSALGAARGRIIRQLLVENMVLAVLGAIAGLALAFVTLRLFVGTAPAALQLDRVRIDGWVIAFALGVAAATAVLFGLYPALRLSGTNAAVALREGTRGTSGKQRLRAWNTLVAVETALAVTLLAGSMVLIRSFERVMRTDLGFDPTNVHTVRVDLPAANYTASSIPGFHSALAERLSGTSGVDAAGFVNRLPLEGAGTSGSIEVEGRPRDPGKQSNGTSIYRVVGGGYFDAVGIRVIAGRVFGAGDDAGAPRVVVVNEEFARNEWPGLDPIGRRVRPFGMDSGDEEPWYTVIGVVASERASGITAPFANTYYFDHRQRPAFRTRTVSYAVRSALPAAQVASLIRREAAAIDPLVPVEHGTMSRIVEQSVASRRFMMLLLGSFAGVALLLALVGIYSVVAYTVAQRTREIGVRMALGATPGTVRQLVLASASRGILPGLVVGALLSVISVRALRSFVYGISPGDPMSLVLAVLVLGAIGVAATVIPAWRATRIDPMIAMRAE